MAAPTVAQSLFSTYGLMKAKMQPLRQEDRQRLTGSENAMNPPLDPIKQRQRLLMITNLFRGLNEAFVALENSKSESEKKLAAAALIRKQIKLVVQKFSRFRKSPEYVNFYIFYFNKLEGLTENKKIMEELQKLTANESEEKMEEEEEEEEE